MPALIAALAVAGLAVGWPQRAVIASLAIPAGHQLPSCEGCGQPASPLPWPWLRRPDPCPGCGRRPGPAALAAGLVTALLLAAVGYLVHPWPVLAAAAWLIVLSVPLSVIDLKVHRLPDALTGPAYAGVLAFLAIAAADAGSWARFGRAALGGIILAASYLALAVLSKGQIGLGDCKTAASTGTLLAWYGWNQLLTGTLAGFLLAGAYGVWLIARHAATRRSHIPFGPFMLAGALLLVLLTGCRFLNSAAYSQPRWHMDGICATQVRIVLSVSRSSPVSSPGCRVRGGASSTTIGVRPGPRHRCSYRIGRPFRGDRAGCRFVSSQWLTG